VRSVYERVQNALQGHAKAESIVLRVQSKILLKEGWGIQLRFAGWGIPPLWVMLTNSDSVM
jgi:hypothetical protein